MTTIKKINQKDSQFGPSFGGKGGTEFYSIFYGKKLVGEMEFDPKQSEILSIYIDNTFRGKGIGRDSINYLFDIYQIDSIKVWAADSSVPFWKKLATKSLGNNYYLIEK